MNKIKINLNQKIHFIGIGGDWNERSCSDYEKYGF